MLFLLESADVMVVVDPRLVPSGQDLPDGAEALLLAGFMAGNGRSQLVSRTKGDAPVGGVRGMLAVYRFLQAKHPAVSSQPLDDLAAREVAGSLDAAVSGRLAAPMPQ